MTSVVALPDPTLLELVGIEVDQSLKMLTAFAVTTSLKARCPLYSGSAASQSCLCTSTAEI
jgi:hypothetical protein